MTTETILALALAFSPPSAPPAPAPVKVATVTKTIVTTRAPVGHTHTDRNGHTWDHQANPTHTCQFCGATQYVQDTYSRPVTVMRTVQVAVPETPPAPPAPPAPPVPRTTTVAAPLYVLPQASSACANGQCSTVSKGRFFR